MYYVAIKSGDYNDGTTWNSAFGTPTLNTNQNLAINTTGVFTQEYVSASSSDSITGVVVLPSGSWASRTITFTLQEDGADTGTTATITGNNTITNNNLFVKLATPYLTTSGKTYRFKMQTDSSTVNVALSTTASRAYAHITKDTTGVPTTGDYFMIASPNANTDITVTITDTLAKIGTGVIAQTFIAPPINRVVDTCIVSGGVSNIAELKFLSSVDTKLSWRSNIGFLVNGKLTQKPDSTHRSDFYMDAGTAIQCWLGFTNGSLVDVQDSKKYPAETWRTTVASGAGTTASPLITNTAVDWAVGDRVVVAPGTNSSTNYNECEEKYIKTKNSSTSYVLSNTAGGAEAGLTYTHDGTHIFNITRNIKWDSNLSNSWHIGFSSLDSSNINHSIKGLEVSGMMGTGSSQKSSMCFNGYGTFEDIVNYGGDMTAYAVFVLPANRYRKSFTRLFTGGGGLSGNSQEGRINVALSDNTTFNDCWVLAGQKVGWKISASVLVFNNCGAIANGISNNSVPSLYSGWNISGANIVLNDCESHADRNSSVLFYDVCADITLNRFVSGTKAKNANSTVRKSSNIPSYTTAYFNNLVQVESVLFTDYLSMGGGSQVSFQNWDGANADSTFTPYGLIIKSGTGLADTTVRTAGGFAMRFEPTYSPNLMHWEQNIPTGNIQSKTMTITCWVYINNAAYYAGTHTKPTLTVTYDQTSTVTAVATGTAGSWQQLACTFTPTTGYGQVEMKITGATDATTTSRYFYVDDFNIAYPAGVQVDLGGLDLWANGLPVEPAIATMPSITGVWDEPLSAHTIAGSAGKILKDGADNAEAAAYDMYK
jgi:hypothetical protein